MKPRFSFVLPVLFFLPLAGCLSTSVKKDFVLSPAFQAQNYKSLAVVNLDPQIQFSHYVEAELLKKGYRVKEGMMVGQLLKKEGFLQEGSLEPHTFPKIAELLQIQGIILCRVLEFSRFRDSYRLSIKCVAPQTGETVWYAEGAKEGRRGQKSSELLKEIVVSSLKGLPSVP